MTEEFDKEIEKLIENCSIGFEEELEFLERLEKSDEMADEILVR